MNPPEVRIALVHALAESIAPLDAVLDGAWPEARRMHLLDSSLSSDLARSPDGVNAHFDERFLALGAYAARTGVAGILFSCSAFGRCIARVAERLAPLPVLTPNEAMIDDAVALRCRVGLVATFAPTLTSMVPEFPASAEVQTALAPGALEALRGGDAALHDALVVGAAERLERAGCGVIALAQFSMARATPLVAARVGIPVLTTVRSAVERLRERIEARDSP